MSDKSMETSQNTAAEPDATSATSWFHPFFRDGKADLHALELPPAFFVVGAPRCGTTSLSKALKLHPKISFSKPKETHFFVRCNPALDDHELRSAYLRQHHKDLAPDHQAIGDGSVSYLYSPRAIELALRFDPRVKFVVLVRNPVDMVPSYHARMVYTLDEDVPDFVEAWSLQERRAAGQRLPKRCRDPRLLQYGHVGRLGRQVERLFDIAGRERCLVILFDDFAKSPRAELRRVLDFVEVRSEDKVKVRIKREARSFKSEWLQQLVMNPPPWVMRLIAHGGKRAIGPLRYVRKRILNINTERRQREALPEPTRAMLLAYFASDVARLSNLLQRDLSHWR
jgi:Sulfotransferase domain